MTPCPSAARKIPGARRARKIMNGATSRQCREIGKNSPDIEPDLTSMVQSVYQIRVHNSEIDPFPFKNLLTFFPRPPRPVTPATHCRHYREHMIRVW